MRYSLILIAAVVSAAAPAFAGGMGDPSAILKQKNAICDAQRRGEGPRYPNLCQQEIPPDAPPPSARGPVR